MMPLSAAVATPPVEAILTRIVTDNSTREVLLRQLSMYDDVQNVRDRRNYGRGWWMLVNKDGGEAAKRRSRSEVH